MEWIASEPLSAGQTERVLQDHLLQAAQMALLPSESERDCVKEAARSVAMYCAPSLSRGIGTQNLHVLFSRALWTVGAVDEARRLLEREVESKRVRAGVLALLSANVSVPELWPLVDRGAIRYGDEWLALENGSVWCLDLNGLPGWQSDTELARSMAGQRLVSLLAPVWDATSGRGHLGLLGSVADCKEAQWMLQSRLEWIAIQRNWMHCPRVVRLK